MPALSAAHVHIDLQFHCSAVTLTPLLLEVIAAPT